MAITTAQLNTVVGYAGGIIFANEGAYSSVNPNDNGALSVGRVQWHGNRALSLLKAICQAQPDDARSILGDALYNEITSAGASAWTSRIATPAEKTAISKLLDTAEGHAAQDAQAKTDIGGYVSVGAGYGLTDDGALIYFADGVNQYGTGSSLWKKIAAQALTGAGDVNAMYTATEALTTQYLDRRKKVRDAVLALNLSPETEASTADSVAVDTVTVLVNGKQVEVTRIFVDDVNYIKLRDLELLGVGLTVGYDETQKLPTISTT
jgi:hypothetical protein